MRLLGTYDKDIPIFNPKTDGNDIFAHMDREEAWIKQLPAPIVRFQIYDGYAVYMYKDGGLYHLPFYGAYELPAAHIRGLRKSDILDRIESDRNMNELFQKRAEA